MDSLENNNDNQVVISFGVSVTSSEGVSVLNRQVRGKLLELLAPQDVLTFRSYAVLWNIWFFT